MATWLEFRCENRSNESAKGDYHNHCWSIDNAGPVGMASDSRESVAGVLRGMGQEAKASGWKRTKYGWVCEYCVKQPNTMAELAEENAV